MIVDLLKKRGSIRNFSDKKISQDIINYILEAGRLSPSGGNEQPWKFGVITEKSLINKISEIAYKQKWIKTAKMLIVLCTIPVADEKGGRNIQKARFPMLKSKIDAMNRELYCKLNQEEHQSKIPGTHMILAALEHGIASTWISYFEVDEVAELLGLPDDYIPGEIIAFGYPEQEINTVKKKDLDDIVFYNRLDMNKVKSDLVAPCGFYCGSCPTYINGDCQGCYEGGAGKCVTYNCIKDKEIDFCGECSDFPCNDIINNEKATILDQSWLKWKKEELRAKKRKE